MDHTTILLTELVNNAKTHLDLLGYTEGTKKQYILKWNHFLMYAAQNGYAHYSKALKNEFLEKYYRIKAGKKLSESQVFKVRTITVLGELLEHNFFNKCHQRCGKQPPQQFLNILDKYEKLQQEKKLSPRTIRGKKIVLVRFFYHLEKQGLTDIKNLTSNEVLSYLPTLEKFRNNTKSGVLFSLRNFLLFLYSEGYITEPLNDLFPVIFSNKFDRLPSYYSTNEVNNLLCQVDRDSTVGRRDYLILLLAVQFGLRAGDIRQLKFQNIKWSRNTIEFIQQKTNAPIQLPLTDEFKYAVADYMKNSRPEVDDPHIFVRHRAPFQPFGESNSFHHIVNKYIKLADIELNGRRHGLHSMRHSTASNLLQNNTPYPVITGILGHKNSATTKCYLRIDIQQLRTVALEVPDEK